MASNSSSYFMEDFPTPFGQDDLEEQLHERAREQPTVPSLPVAHDDGGLGQNQHRVGGQAPTMNRVNSLYQQDQQEFRGFLDSMTYLEPYQNRKLHQNTVAHSPMLNASNTAQQYQAPNPRAGDFGGHSNGAQGSSQHHDRPIIPLQSNQDLIDPDQLLNRSAPQIDMYRNDRSTFDNTKADQTNQMTSAGISNDKRGGTSDKNGKTSAQALFSSDGEEEIAEGKKQLEGNQAKNKDLFSNFDSAT